MNIDGALDLFLIQLDADGRSTHTIGQYRRHVRLLSSWLTSEDHSTRVDSICHEVLARFLISGVATLRPDGAPKKATSTNALRSSIRVFFRYCHDCGHLALNPARLIRRAICSPPPPRGLSDDDKNRLLESLDRVKSFENQRDAALVRTMLGTGLRISSALALRVEDVDLVARDVEIRSAKGDRPDRLPISTGVARVLREWISDRVEGILFGSRSARPLSTRHVQRRFRLAVERAGITRAVSPHSLRHAFAMSLYSRSGGDIAVVQAALRHRSITSTLIYARADARRLRAAIG